MKKRFSRIYATVLVALTVFNFIVPTVSAVSETPFETQDSLRRKIIASASGDRNALISRSRNYLGDTGRYIVVFDQNVSLSRIYSAVSGYKYRLLADSDERIFLINLEDKEEFLKENESIIVSIEEDGLKETYAYPNDTYSRVYELEMLGMSNVWDISQGSKDVIVAILDSGIDRYHEDFSGTSILSGYDYESGQSIVNTDESGHGTKIAGIIASTSNNSVGCAGIAPNCTILPLKITSSGKIYTSDFIDSIYLAADSGAKVINMSLGSYEKLESEEKAIKYALKKNCILVAASGNEGNHGDYAGMKCYPASYDGVISVGAVDENGNGCIFSQHNDAVDISAPGSGLSLLQSGGGYTIDSGTSFSSAYISGVAALAVSVLDDGYDITSDQFDFLISNYAIGEKSTRTGYGLISPIDVITHANYPLVSGIEPDGIYYDNVKISFNRGEALLDSEEFKNGDLCKYTGEHILEVTEGEKTTVVHFVTDNLPLSFSLKEGDGYSYVSFPIGTATLNGHPYKSGDRITTDGHHTLTLTGLYGNTKSFDFNLSFAPPKVSGVENGEIYTRPVRISVSTGGTIYLGGKEQEKEFTVYEEGQHTLLIKQNGNLKTSINFTISYEEENNPYKYKTFDSSITDGKSVSDGKVIVVWNDLNRGIRLFDGETMRLIRYVNVGENVKAVVFSGDSLFVSGTNHIFAIKKDVIKSTSTLEKLHKFDFPVSAADFGDDALYCVESSSVASGTVKKISLDSFTETDISFVRSIPDVISYDKETASVAFGKKEDGKIFVSPISGESLAVVSPFDSDSISGGFIFRNGKLSCGGKVFSLQKSKTIFAINDKKALYFDGTTLITEKGIYNTESGEVIGKHGIELTSVSKNDNLYVAAYGDHSLYVSNSLPTAPEPKRVVTEGESIGYTGQFSLSASYTNAVASGNRIYASADENALYILDGSTLECVDRVYLPFTPTGIKTAGNSVYAYSNKVNLLSVYSIRDKKITSYETPETITDMSVYGKYAAFVMNGSLRVHDVNGNRLFIDDEEEYISVSFSHDGRNLYAVHYRSFYTGLTSYNLADFSVDYDRILDYEATDIFCDSTYIYINTAAYLTRNGGLAASCSSKIYGKTPSAFITATGVFADDEYKSNYNASGNAFILKENGELMVFGEGEVRVFKNPYGDDCFSPPAVSGVTQGGSFSSGTTISFSKGTGYLNGVKIENGHVVSDGGEHQFMLILPFGLKYSYKFKINASLTSLRIKGGDTAIKVNGKRSFQAEFLPVGSPAEDVMFYCDGDVISVTPDGVVTGLRAGETKLYAATMDGRIYTSIKITVLSSMLEFTPSYIGTDRTDGILYGISSGTTTEMLLGFLEPSLREDVVIYHGETVASGILKTGMRISLLSKKGEVLDSLLISVTGDCNGDGNVDIGDLAAACELMGKEDGEKVFIKSADFSNTGTIDVADTFTYKEIILGNEKIVENANTEKPLFDGELFLNFQLEQDGTVSVSLFAKGKNVKGLSGKLEYDSESFAFLSAKKIGYISGVEEGNGCISFLSVFRGDVEETVKLLEISFLPKKDTVSVFNLSQLVGVTDQTFVCGDISKSFSFKENALSELNPSAGTLIPEFSPDVYSYVLRLPEDVTELTFSHVGTGDISVIMSTPLSDGSVIKIKHEDKEYEITVVTDYRSGGNGDGLPLWLIIILSASAVSVIFFLFFGKNIKKLLSDRISKKKTSDNP